jgi:glycosyltransferase involved in cell wall biosynthesis
MVQTNEKPRQESLRVVIVTENVSLRMSGETSVPYYYFKLLQARGHDVWMVCHARTRDELREIFSEEIFKKISFVEDNWLQVAIYKMGQLFPYRIEDLIFGQMIHLITQWQARSRVKQLIKEHHISIVFEPTPITPKGLSFMYDLGVPVAIGPMCGGLELPPAFRYMDSPFTHFFIEAARFLSWIGHRLVPGKLKADVLLVGNQRTAKALPQGYRGKVYELVESGVDLSRWKGMKAREPQPDQPVRFVFCGRMVDWKGAQFLVEAFKPVVEQTNSVLELIGDGELKESIEARVKELGIQDSVNFHGRIPIEECMKLFCESDVYVMPSLRECGGLALLEAMSVGLPVIAAKWAGPVEYLNDTCSILVEPSSQEDFINGFAKAMITLAKSPEQRRCLGEGSTRRVTQNYFDWESKTERVLEILKETVALASSKVLKKVSEFTEVREKDGLIHPN